MAGAGLLLLSAALAGVAVSAPPGPVGAVCIARTIRHGPAAGLWSGLGAAVGDALYGLIVVAGLATVTGGRWEGQGVVALIAAPILLIAGIRVLRRAHRGQGADAAAALRRPSAGSGTRRIASYFGSACLLTLGAPGTLPAFLGLFATFDLPGDAHPRPVGVLLVCAGVLVGCMAWWLLVCGLVHRFRGRAARGLPLVDYASGALLVLAGVSALVAGVVAFPVQG